MGQAVVKAVEEAERDSKRSCAKGKIGDVVER